MEEFVIANSAWSFARRWPAMARSFPSPSTLGPTLSFPREKPTSLDTSKVDTLQKGTKRKLSPSQVRRNLKKREDF